MRRQVRMMVRLALVVLFMQSLHGSQPAEKKPMVLVVYADWCPLCQRLKPALALINERYTGKINFVLLDVTSETTTAQSRQRARSLGLEEFFDKNYDATSLVVIRNSGGHEVFRARHDYEFQHYAKILDQQLGSQPRPQATGH